MNWNIRSKRDYEGLRVEMLFLGGRGGGGMGKGLGDGP